MKKYLIVQERTIIEWECKQGTSLRKIAKLLNWHHSTIIYEVNKIVTGGNIWHNKLKHEVKKN